MKIPLPVSVLLAVAIAALWAGCNTFEKRAQEKSEVFQSLDAETQDRLHKGTINVGDTPDMVYIALGVPDAKKQRIANDGRELIWIYKTYYQDYVGSELVGYRRYLVPAGPNRYVVRYEPVRRDVYDERSEENMRVTFMNGRVTMIEQAQR
jgi:hypothetical protein